MFQGGEYLTFVAEPLQNEVFVQAALNQLNSDAMLELAIGAPGFVHRAHPAASDLPLDAVRPDVTAYHRFFIVAFGRLGLKEICFFGQRLFHATSKLNVHLSVKILLKPPAVEGESFRVQPSDC